MPRDSNIGDGRRKPFSEKEGYCLYFLEVFLDAALVLFEQLQTFGQRMLTLAHEFSIALDIANRHSCGSQALEELDPGHMLGAIGAIAIPLIPPNMLDHQSGTFVIAQGMSAQPGCLSHLLDVECFFHDLLFHSFPFLVCTFELFRGERSLLSALIIHLRAHSQSREKAHAFS